jgi:hypothetical protein
MEDFQARYCRGGPGITPAFGCIPRWWAWTITELQTKGTLQTLFGFRRTFLGRPNDPATHREAVAFQPQGTTAQRMNLGMWRVWRHEPRVGLLAQGFDSIVFQFRETTQREEDEIMQHVLDLIKVELRSPSGRRYAVPGDAKVGWNWGNENTEAMNAERVKRHEAPMPLNPDGLRKWKSGLRDGRTRQRFPGMGFGGGDDISFWGR